MRGNVQPGAERAVLVVEEPDGEKQIFPLSRNPTVIGRSNNADLVLPDPSVSDFHARVIKHSFGFTIEDMGSADGTFLRDKRVNHARLISGDTLRVGTTALTFLDERANAGKPQSLVQVRSTARGITPRSTVVRDAYSQTSSRSNAHQFQPTQPATQAPPHHRRRPSESDEEAPSIEDVLLNIIRVWRFLRQRLWLDLHLLRRWPRTRCRKLQVLSTSPSCVLHDHLAPCPQDQPHRPPNTGRRIGRHALFCGGTAGLRER